MTTRIWENAARYRPSFTGGHYESYFQRANHPSRPLAFWIRYTIFSPKNRPEATEGEVWAIYFDGEAGQISAVRNEIPFAQCVFNPEKLEVRVGDSTLDQRQLQGVAKSLKHQLSWELSYQGEERPLLFLPRKFYEGGFPKAKALVGTPFAEYSGKIIVDGEEVEIDRWVGSQNHNWGIRHTDHYAWGQVAGFDEEPDAFLECASARIRLGPIWSPMFTMAVLRMGEEEYAIHTLGQAVRGKATFSPFDWRWKVRGNGMEMEGHLEAPRDRFIGLTYRNPPGGSKTCLNSKLASCSLTLRLPDGEVRTLQTKHRAAFEILTEGTDFGVEIV